MFPYSRSVLIVAFILLTVHIVSGAHITFVVTDDTESTAKLYTIDPNNPVPNLILDLSQTTFGMIRDPEFSPNGHWIAFSSEYQMMPTPWRQNLFVMDRYGGNLQSITHLTPGSFPPNSPTGTVEGIVYEDGEPKSNAWVHINALEESATTDIYGHYRLDNVPVGSMYVTAYDSNILYDDEDFGFIPVTVIANFTSTADVTLSWDWDNQQGASDATWTPNGQEILFVDNSGNSNRIPLDGSSLTEVTPLPDGVNYFTDMAVRPGTGEVAYITDVFYGDESLKGIWLSNANGSNMRQIVSDNSYGMGSLHWSPDGSMIGYSTTVVDGYGNYVNGMLFYDDQGQLVNGIALEQEWFAEFGGWDPSQQYVCISMWPSSDYGQAKLYTVRLSDYATVELFGPAVVSFPSWGPDATPISESIHVTPETLVLGPAYPNPSRGIVTVRLTGSEGVDFSGLHLGVYDMGGRYVSRIPVLGNSAIWDGFDDSGTPVPSGSYFIAPLDRGFTSTGTRVILLK